MLLQLSFSLDQVEVFVLNFMLKLNKLLLAFLNLHFQLHFDALLHHIELLHISQYLAVFVRILDRHQVKFLLLD